MAVQKFNAEWQKEIDRVSFSMGKKMFSGRSIAHSSLQSNKLVMNQTLANFLKTEFLANLQITYSYLWDLAYAAEEGLKQNILINSVNDAASKNSKRGMESSFMLRRKHCFSRMMHLKQVEDWQLKFFRL